MHTMSRLRCLILPALLLLVAGALAGCSGDKDAQLILATTTSTQDSGLLDELIPMFEDEYGYDVDVIAVGSGAAMEMGRNGDADVLLVHSPAAEQQFVDEGFASDRKRVMYNDFVIVGPQDDPAGISGMTDVATAFAQIASTESKFVSRGDDSGTHAKEKTIWAAADLEVPQGAGWYAESGQGMGATLTIAGETGAYTISDRATWLAAGNADELALVVEGDERLFNVYHVLVVNPDSFDNIDLNTKGAEDFRDFLLSDGAQTVISNFGTERYGQALFTGDPE